jgi:hypothetical protein
MAEGDDPPDILADRTQKILPRQGLLDIVLL